MELQDEAIDALDDMLIPMGVREVLVDFWDDNESDRTNIQLISHWINIATGPGTNAPHRGIESNNFGASTGNARCLTRPSVC